MESLHTHWVVFLNKWWALLSHLKSYLLVIGLMLHSSEWRKPKYLFKHAKLYNSIQFFEDDDEIEWLSCSLLLRESESAPVSLDTSTNFWYKTWTSFEELRDYGNQTLIEFTYLEHTSPKAGCIVQVYFLFLFIYYYFSLYFYCWHYYRCSHFLPFAASTQPTPLPSGHHHTVVCVYGSCIYILWLIPSP